MMHEFLFQGVHHVSENTRLVNVKYLPGYFASFLLAMDAVFSLKIKLACITQMKQEDALKIEDNMIKCQRGLRVTQYHDLEERK